MLDEISAAVLFLTRLVSKSKNINEAQIEEFGLRVSALLFERFRDHWFPEQPFKGQGYRCIRVNEMDRRDPILERAAKDCGLRYEDLQLPVELTIWVDPDEVCCRFGEHKGSYCTVASFRDDDKENFTPRIGLVKMEHNVIEKTKQVLTPLTPRQRTTVRHRNNSNNIVKQQHQFYPRHAVHNSSSSSYFCVPQMSHATKRIGSSYVRRRHACGNALSSPPPIIGLEQQLQQQTYTIPRNDRYHWVNQSLVKV